MDNSANPDHVLLMCPKCFATVSGHASDIGRTMHAYVGMRDGMLLGDLSKGYTSFGLGLSQIRVVEPVQAVMDGLMRGVPS